MKKKSKKQEKVWTRLEEPTKESTISSTPITYGHIFGLAIFTAICFVFFMLINFILDENERSVQHRITMAVLKDKRETLQHIWNSKRMTPEQNANCRAAVYGE